PHVCTTMKPVHPEQKEPINTRPWRKQCSHVFIMILCIGGMVNNMGCVKEIKAMLEIKVYEMGEEKEIFSSEAWRRAFDINEPIYTELCHEFYATYNFDEDLTDDELMTNKLIKFRLGRGLRSDQNFNAREYWLSISSEDELHLSRSLTSKIRSHVLKFITRMARRMNLLTDKVLDGLSAPTYCRALDATTLRELIGSNGSLIVEDPVPGVPRVAMHRPPRPSISDLYDRMGRMDIRQGQLERISRIQLYHTDRYIGVF
ncbi:hypothetical protein Tco_0947813, partial [Tanacetum coccineum]